MSMVRRRSARIVVVVCAWSLHAALVAESGLLLSEYIEGSGNNKAVEIFNPDTTAVDLTNVTVELYSNGNLTNNVTIALSGQLTGGAAYVIAHTSATNTLTSMADRLTGSLSFNGDDAIVLKMSGQVLDSIGQVGLDPGTAWGSNGVSTADSTLRRLPAMTTGDTNVADSFDPSAEWASYPIDTYDGLGSHTIAVPTGTDADHDGMPDDWEVLMFGSLDALGGQDADGDGLSNWEEYVAGTGPMDTGSVFQLTQMAMTDSVLVLSWLGGSNVTQVLEYAESSAALLAGQWQAVFSNASSSALGQCVWSNPPVGCGYFRLRATR